MLQVTCQKQLNISSTAAFYKFTAWDGSPRGVPYKEKYVFYVFFARGQISRADRHENLHDGPRQVIPVCCSGSFVATKRVFWA